MNLHLFLPVRLNRSGPPAALYSTGAELCSYTVHTAFSWVSVQVRKGNPTTNQGSQRL